MKRTLIAAMVVVAAVSVAVLGPWSCSPAKYSGKVESITVGMESTAVNSLIYLAENRNYFAANGLNVIIKDYPSGLAAVNGMLANEVDIATAAEFVIVGKAFTNEPIRTFATIDKFLHNYLIGRKDRGIESPSDLKGKRIGVPLKTAAEFYLGRFLDLRGMNIKQVDLVNVSPSQAVDALVGGEVDAIIAWRPNVNAIQDRLRNAVTLWRAQNEQATYCSAISAKAWAAKHPELISRFLKSLVQAEDYNVTHPEEARAIVQKKLQYDDAYMATVWPEHQLSVSLDQSVILAMEDEARWMINNNLTGEKKTPEFRSYIYVDGLDAVRPNSVSIIR